MTTLKEFEDALKEHGMQTALAILEMLRQRDRSQRSIAPPRRVRGAKMTPELARRIMELHSSTAMTQQEIAFKLGVNQGRVNEVVKRGKWLSDKPDVPKPSARDRTLARSNLLGRDTRTKKAPEDRARRGTAGEQTQLTLQDL